MGVAPSDSHHLFQPSRDIWLSRVANLKHLATVGVRIIYRKGDAANA